MSSCRLMETFIKQSDRAANAVQMCCTSDAGALGKSSACSSDCGSRPKICLQTFSTRKTVNEDLPASSVRVRVFARVYRKLGHFPFENKNLNLIRKISVYTAASGR